MTKNTHIEIVRSSHAWLSSLSLVSCTAIYDVLSKHYQSVGISTVNTVEDLHALVARQPDLVFLGMKFVPVEAQGATHDSDKIWVSEFLQQHGIAHTGSEHAAHELELNKALAKRRVQAAGLNTSAFHITNPADNPNLATMNLNFPVFIKPSNRGGGLGIDDFSVAHNLDQAQSKVLSITNTYGADSLIEEYLPGREFSVAILKDEHTQDFRAMPLELVAPANKQGYRILSKNVKHEDTEQFCKVTDAYISKRVTDLALGAFQALGARDYGRIDIRLDSKGTAHFLEANLIPSLLNNFGNFPKACLLNIGLGYEDVILSIVRLALARVTKAQTEESFAGLPISVLAIPDISHVIAV